MRRSSFGPWIAGLPLVFFLLIVPLALLVHGHSSFLGSVSSPTSLEAMRVSMITTFSTLGLLLVFGTPVASGLARLRGPFGAVLETFFDLPVVMPPAAAGIGLLVAFGREGLIPTKLPFTAGAVVCAQLLVSSPLYIRSATAAFRAVPQEVLEQAQLEGLSGFMSFFRVVVPLSRPVLASGAAMAWGRSLGEFGATMLFAGSLEGRTETLPIAVYLGFESDLDQAIGLSLLLLLVAIVVIAISRCLLALRPEP